MGGPIVPNKLYVDMSKGIVEVEGDVDLVREVYSDFKERLLRDAAFGVAGNDTSTGLKPEKGKEPKRAKSRSRKSKETSETAGSLGIDPDSPKLDKEIDTSGLSAHFGEFEPRTHSEKILIFLMFLTEKLGIKRPNTDQIFTCYRKTGQRLPKAFGQAFRDTSNRHGYIDYNSPNDIAVTTAGMNHFNHDLKTKAPD